MTSTGKPWETTWTPPQSNAQIQLICFADLKFGCRTALPCLKVRLIWPLGEKGLHKKYSQPVTAWTRVVDQQKGPWSAFLCELGVSDLKQKVFFGSFGSPVINWTWEKVVRTTVIVLLLLGGCSLQWRGVEREGVVEQSFRVRAVTLAFLRFPNRSGGPLFFRSCSSVWSRWRAQRNQTGVKDEIKRAGIQHFRFLL